MNFASERIASPDWVSPIRLESRAHLWERDLIVEPGMKFQSGMPMPNAMVCHITEGELVVHQDGGTFTAPQFHVWTCNKGTDEWVENKGTVRGVMRITDLKA